MSRIKVPQTLSNIENPDEVQRYLAQTMDQVVSTINGGISFANNMDAQIVGVTFTSANMNVIVEHKLGRMPVGYIPVTRTAAITIYDGSAVNTTKVLNVRASGTGGANLFIF